MTSLEAYAAIDAGFGAAPTLETLRALDDEGRSRLHQYWLDRASGELTTALAFEFMLDDLSRENVPAPIRELARTAIEDEHRHVDYCLRWARLIEPGKPAEAHFGGTRPYSFDGASEHDDRILRTIFGGCFSETIAVHVLGSSHRRIRDENVRRLNHEHLREEVLHARLGWALASWPGLSARDRSMIAAHVPHMKRLARELWLSTTRPPDDALCALGFLSTDLVTQACDEALDGVTLPGLAECGIE